MCLTGRSRSAAACSSATTRNSACTTYPSSCTSSTFAATRCAAPAAPLPHSCMTGPGNHPAGVQGVRPSQSLLKSTVVLEVPAVLRAKVCVATCVARPQVRGLAHPEHWQGPQGPPSDGLSSSLYNHWLDCMCGACAGEGPGAPGALAGAAGGALRPLRGRQGLAHGRIQAAAPGRVGAAVPRRRPRGASHLPSARASLPFWPGYIISYHVKVLQAQPSRWSQIRGLSDCPEAGVQVQQC